MQRRMNDPMIVQSLLKKSISKKLLTSIIEALEIKEENYSIQKRQRTVNSLEQY